MSYYKKSVDNKFICMYITSMKKLLKMNKVKLVGKNAKWVKQPITTKEYKDFKKTIHMLTKPVDIVSPQELLIQVRSFHDIDAIVQVVLDGMQGRAYENDRTIQRLVLEKFPIKKGQLGSIGVFGHTLKKKLVWRN